MNRRIWILATIIWASLLISTGVAADYPTRPINILIGYAPGGSTDLTTRVLASEISKILKQPVICNNQPGASGSLVLGRAKVEKPDGYTIFNSSSAALSRMPHLQPVSYDPLKDFSYIMQYGLYQFGLVVRADSPWKTFEEFIDYAKKNPKKIKYATAGLGGAQHLFMEYLGRELGIQWDVVPFTSGPQTVTALLGGHVQSLAQTPEWKEHVLSGKLRLLIILTAKRSGSFPDVPTILEKGYPFACEASLNFVGPAGMPKPVIEELQNAFHQAMESKTFLDVMDKFDLVPLYRDSEALTKFVEKDYKINGELIKSLGMGIYKKQ